MPLATQPGALSCDTMGEIGGEPGTRAPGFFPDHRKPNGPDLCDVPDSRIRSRYIQLMALAAIQFPAVLALHPAGPEHGSLEQRPIWVETWNHGWMERWTHEMLGDRATHYGVVDSDPGPALRARSRSSASALWHPLDLSVPEDAVISWSWKVSATYEGNDRERRKEGDDYPARLFVLFDEPGFEPDGRAICYVWASTEPVGSLYENPYFETVTTIVVASGAREAGGWTSFQRDFVRDYRIAFGDRPTAVTGVAVMVDSDDTARQATTWFGPLQIRYPRAADPP